MQPWVVKMYFPVSMLTLCFLQISNRFLSLSMFFLTNIGFQQFFFSNQVRLSTVFLSHFVTITSLKVRFSIVFSLIFRFSLVFFFAKISTFICFFLPNFDFHLVFSHKFQYASVFLSQISIFTSISLIFRYPLGPRAEQN